MLRQLTIVAVCLLVLGCGDAKPQPPIHWRVTHTAPGGNISQWYSKEKVVPYFGNRWKFVDAETGGEVYIEEGSMVVEEVKADSEQPAAEAEAEKE